MLDHVSITVSDISAAERFYDAIMKELGVVKVGRRDDRLGCHRCFKAKWRTQVDAFWDTGIAAGGSDDGPPGLRSYHASCYAAFLRDPDGSRIEAVCHQAV